MSASLCGAGRGGSGGDPGAAARQQRAACRLLLLQLWTSHPRWTTMLSPEAKVRGTTRTRIIASTCFKCGTHLTELNPLDAVAGRGSHNIKSSRDGLQRRRRRRRRPRGGLARVSGAVHELLLRRALAWGGGVRSGVSRRGRGDRPRVRRQALGRGRTGAPRGAQRPGSARGDARFGPPRGGGAEPLQAPTHRAATGVHPALRGRRRRFGQGMTLASSLFSSH